VRYVGWYSNRTRGERGKALKVQQPAVGPLGPVDRLGGAREHETRLVEEDRANMGQGDAPARAFEQAHAEIPLEALDRLRQDKKLGLHNVAKCCYTPGMHEPVTAPQIVIDGTVCTPASYILSGAMRRPSA
jgi:hypothetical protein